VSRVLRAAAPLGPRWILLFMIRVYRAAISPTLPRACRFVPSCAAYAEEAVATKSLGRALGLILGRISKCHPFHPGGFDPVP